MSEQTSTQNQTPEDKAAVKAAKMAVYAEKFKKIKVGQEAVAQLEGDASDYAKTIVKEYGRGPHKISIDGKPHVVQFQLVNGAVRANVLDLDSLA